MGGGPGQLSALVPSRPFSLAAVATRGRVEGASHLGDSDAAGVGAEAIAKAGSGRGRGSRLRAPDFLPGPASPARAEGSGRQVRLPRTPPRVPRVGDWRLPRRRLHPQPSRLSWLAASRPLRTRSRDSVVTGTRPASRTPNLTLPLSPVASCPAFRADRSAPSSK